ncbi:MAG: L,D-transpeptidase family protein [Chitinophagaceae bacterium]|nr:L,D-transpeptidase family protein [Chitinophagaceae bacterium]
MNSKILSNLFLTIFIATLLIVSCRNAEEPPKTDVATTPEQLIEKTEDNIRKALTYAEANNGDIGDSTFLMNNGLVQAIYEQSEYKGVWSDQESWKISGDSIIKSLGNIKQYGLFAEDYHFNEITRVNNRFLADTSGKADRRDAALWSKAELMLTDAFFEMVKDVKLGRLPKDSLTLRKDSILTDSFYLQQWQIFRQSNVLSQVLDSLEPTHPGYISLKAGIRKFLDSADNRPFTPVPLPSRDTLGFRKALQTRLFEEGLVEQDSTRADSAQLASAIRSYQKKKGLTVDGKAGSGTIRMLNLTDKEKFIRIAIAMDRYKLLPERMPSRYVWVNLPSYYMQLVDNDTVKLSSKIICGKPITRTPLLTSAISEMITYPQWTVPTSIITKEILPAAKKDPGYFATKGFSLVDKDGNEVDPYTVDWTKYTKGIPYKVVQGSGDDNALGILKFNFYNKYSVYLHDTNQRYLFAQAFRSLSHGCVRVQEWEKLAYHLLKYDNPDEEKLMAKEDSLSAWLLRKEKHSIPIRNRVPVYIRYFTVEGKQKGIVFYDDIYGEDRLLREKYFANK